MYKELSYVMPPHSASAPSSAINPAWDTGPLTVNVPPITMVSSSEPDLELGEDEFEHPLNAKLNISTAAKIKMILFFLNIIILPYF